MSRAYTQLTVHAVIVVKQRMCLIKDDFKEHLFAYIGGILREIKCHPIIVGGYQDHVHILYEMSTTTSICEQMRIVKCNSSKWVNESNFSKKRFEWQNGYGAFAISRAHRERVINYINNQESHHKKESFRSEYMEFLKHHEMEVPIEFLFEFVD